MKLKLPLKYIKVTQYFGKNEVPFYKELGMIGHNGIDLKAYIGCELKAMQDGMILFAGYTQSGGNCIVNWNYKNRLKTIYFHLSKIYVKEGDRVIIGEPLGKTGNTGKYTTGAHLHAGGKETDSRGNTINHNNGYNGAIDISKFFPKNWDRSNAYHRYGRKQNWFADFCFMFAPIGVNNKWAKDGRWVHKKLKSMGIKPPLSTEKVNAIIYGGWDFKTVMNEGLRDNWAYLKKDEYNQGVRAFK